MLARFDPAVARPLDTRRIRDLALAEPEPESGVATLVPEFSERRPYRRLNTELSKSARCVVRCGSQTNVLATITGWRTHEATATAGCNVRDGRVR